MSFETRNLDDDRRRRLDELLQDNPLLRELLKPTEPSAVDRALDRLSLVRSFDETMYREAFHKYDPTLAPFEDIIHHPDVQPVPRTGGKYWLSDSMQAHGLTRWEGQPEDRAVWDARIFEWLSQHGADPSERLAVLLRFDRDKARAFLEKEYEKADEQNDLVLCHALIEQVEANLTQIAGDERLPFERFAARYRSRALFLNEFHRTTEYFSRSDLEDAFQEFLRAEGAKWILYLSARGGMGKTMFIHRMIAHELVRRPPFSLVVRLDLDDLEVSSLASVPWLMAIEMATQLDQQLTVSLFRGGTSGFIDTVTSFSPLLYKRQSERARSIGDSERQSLMNAARQQFANWDVFKSRCLELPKNRPLVVFVDTLEEASLHYPSQFRRLLERCEELHQSLPQLRLVLSGRYPPDMTHFPEYGGLKTQTRFEQLNPLDRWESEAFVRWRLPQADPDITAEMVVSGEGNPFKLSMLCEVVRYDPSMTATALREYQEADVAYLIKRVIERIPAEGELGLRWLLRYGSVPRRLTFSFVQDILLPLLVRALRGEVESDQEDIPSNLERTVWLQDASAKLDASVLWTKLSKYAGEHSWISVDPRDPNTMSLHPDVIAPMRKLLQGQQIYMRLHQEAARHFAKLRTDQPDRWLDFTLAEIYHRSQLGDETLLPVVKAAFKERPSYADATRRLELAREIARADGDFRDAPLTVRAWAHYEAADAIAVAANFTYVPDDDRRDEISRSLDQACELAGKARLQLPSFVWRWREFLASNHPTTRSAILNLLFGMSGGDERMRYWLLLVDLFGQGKLQRRLISRLFLLFEMVPGLIHSDRVPDWVAREHFAGALMQLGDYEYAIRILRGVLDHIERQGMDEHVDRVRAELIGVLLGSLDLRAAEEELARFPSDKSLTDQRQLLEAYVELGRRDAWAALDAVERMADHRNFRYHLVRANALGQLLRIDEALKSFALAHQSCVQGRSQADIDRVSLDEARFRLFEAGMPMNQLVTRTPDSRAGAELDLIRAYQLRTNSAAAGRAIQAQTQGWKPIVTRIRAMCCGMSWGLTPATELDQLKVLLTGITPSGARLGLMIPPALLGAPWKATWLQRLDLRTHTAPSIGSESNGLAWLLYGRLLRVIGDEKRAAVAFGRITVSDVPTRAELAMFRQRRLAELNPEPARVGFWDGLKDEPALYAAVMVENTERAVKHGDISTARESLARANRDTGLTLSSAWEQRRQVVREALQRLGGEITETQTGESPKTEHLSENVVSGADTTSQLKYHCVIVATEHRYITVEDVTPTAFEPNGKMRRAGDTMTRVSTTENDALAILAMYSRERSPRRLLQRFVANWQQTVYELREPLLGAATAPMAPEAAVDPFVLVLTSPALVATPWELAIPVTHWPVRVGPGRPDSGFADQLRQAPEHAVRLLSRIARPSIGAPSVTVYNPSPDVESVQRELGALCSNQGLPFVPEGHLGTTDVIYLFASIHDSPSFTEPFVGRQMTGEMLGREISGSRRDGSKPVVILHVPGSPGLSERIEQAFARNQFAQSLIDSGSVSGVLATGLCTNRPDETRLAAAVVQSLRGSATLIEIVRRLRAGALAEDPRADATEGTLSVAGTALFLRPTFPE